MLLIILPELVVKDRCGFRHPPPDKESRAHAAIFYTKNCQTKNLWVNIEIRRCTKKIHLLRLIICLTQTPNLEIISLKIGHTPNWKRDYFIHHHILEVIPKTANARGQKLLCTIPSGWWYRFLGPIHVFAPTPGQKVNCQRCKIVLKIGREEPPDQQRVPPASTRGSRLA